MLSNEPFLWRGSGEHACLLLHGLGGGVYELQWLAERLLAAGLTVQGFNYPGHDRPATPHAPFPLDGVVWAGFGTLPSSAPGVPAPFARWGFPPAACWRCTWPFAHPVHKLVLLAPFFAIRHRWYYLFRLEQYLNSLGWLLDDVPRFRLPIRDGEVRALAEKVAYFRSFNLTAVRSALELIEQVKGEVASIQVPTLILQPRQDTVVDPDQAVWLYRELGSAEKSLQWLERSDHVLTLDCERETVFAQVCAFLTQDPAPAALG
jgi:carboxylesterase